MPARHAPIADGRFQPAQRRINAAQFAFLRAVVLGMPLRAAADRYLDERMDLRKVQAELRWLRTELLAAARRAQAFGDARALQLDMAQLPVTAKEVRQEAAPTLDEFRLRVDPDGFYPESELLALYQEQHPPAAADRRKARIARLRERQRRSLATLERVLVRPPTLADPPSAWLEPKLARRIETVGFTTLGALVDWIQLRGQRWWVRVPKVGEVAAGRVVDWLWRNREALGIELDLATRLPRRALVDAWRDQARPEKRIAPLERLAVPSDLDGSTGSNRLQGVAQLRASNDRQAIEAWIEARAGSNANTARAYRREAERLLLWSIFERRLAMSSLTVDDAIAFRAFLRNPAPDERWVSRRAAIRLSPAWRPFNGPLSERSVAFAITVVGSLFDWLVRQHYLAHNIFSALPRVAPINAAAEADPDRLEADSSRFLTHSQWSVMRSVLPALGSDEAGLRARLTILLGYTTGLRRAELLDARVGRLQSTIDNVENVNDTDDTDNADNTDNTDVIDEAGGNVGRRVVLRVLGKGGKLRTVPIVPQVEQLLDDYLALRGLPGWVACQREGLNGVRLLGHLDGRRAPEAGLSPKMIYLIVKEAFAQAEAVLRKRGLDHDAEVFARASTHWLRHTFGRHALAGDVKVNVVQAILGHASLQTTTLYSSDDSNEAYDAVRKFTRKRL